MRNFNSICDICHRVYAKDSSNNGMCSQCLDMIKLQQKQKPNRTCSKCGREYYSPNSNKICHFCKFKPYNTIYKPEKDYSLSNPKKKTKRKCLPLEEQIKRMEWKRVWDDYGWKRYLRYGNIDR